MSFLEIFRTGKLPDISQYRDYVEMAKNRYGMEIADIEFADIQFETERQARLTLYILSCSPEMKNEIIRNRMNYPLNDNHHFSGETLQTADRLLSDFFSFCGKSAPEDRWIYIRLLMDGIREAIYGHSIAKIKKRLNPKYVKYHVSFLVYYEPVITVLIRRPAFYDIVAHSPIAQEIRRQCYKIAKKYDKFDLLTLENLQLKFVDESQLSTEMKNNYAREV